MSSMDEFQQEVERADRLRRQHQNRYHAEWGGVIGHGGGGGGGSSGSLGQIFASQIKPVPNEEDETILLLTEDE